MQLERSAAAKIEDLLYQVGGLFRCADNDFEIGSQLRRQVGFAQGYVRVADDRGQEVAEVVGDAG